MTTISAPDLALLRGENHRSQFYLTPCPAIRIWEARIDGALSRGETAVTFDDGDGTDFSVIGELQELWIGSESGLHDVGRIRIRGISSGDGGITGTVTVAANSIEYSDDDYLSFIAWYLPKPLRPFIDGNGTFYKDKDIPYTDQNSQPNPVCIAGENRAGFIDSGLGYMEIESQLPNSYAIADGATISSYGATLVHGADTPTIAVNSGTGVGSIQFPSAGVYWIKWTVTDSNGKSQDSYRWYYAYDESPTGEQPITSFSINNISSDWGNGGWQAGIQMSDRAELDDIPDMAPIILWSDNWYGDTKKNITYLPDESGTLINGYVKRDKFSADFQSGLPDVSFEINTIQAMIEEHYNFSVSLEVSTVVDTWWKYPVWMTPTRAVHHFYKWHSTIMEVCDVFGLMDNVDPIAYAEFQDGTVMQMPQSFIADRSIRANIVADAGGRLHVVEDVQLRPDAERSGLTIVQDITPDDQSATTTYIREQVDSSPFVHTSGFQFTGAFDSDGAPIANAICAIAPGDDVQEVGGSPVSYGRQTFIGQTHANEIAGRILAAENNRYPELRITFSGNYLTTLGCHFSELWTSTLVTDDTVRKIFESFRLILRNVTATISVSQGTVLVSATFEAESEGDVGQATNCPTFPDLPGFDYDIPDIEDLGGAAITAASVNYLSPQTKDWTVRTAEATSHMYADPFWQTTQDSFASKDAILWRGGVGYIKRSVDGGENWSNVTPSTNPPNDAGDAPAPLNTDVNYAQGDGSFINDQEHVFIARWQNASMEWRSWWVYTDDDGANWTWKSLASGSGGTTTITAFDGDNGTNPQSRSVLMLNSTILLVLAFGQSGNKYAISLIDTTTGLITDTVDLSETDNNVAAIARLSDSRFVYIVDEGDAGYLTSAVFDVVAGVATSVASQVIHNQSGVSALAVERISDTKFLVGYNVDAAGSANGVIRVGEYDEVSTITYGAESAFNAGSTPYFTMRWMELSGDNLFDLYYQQGSQMRGVEVNVNVATDIIGYGIHTTIISSTCAYISMEKLDSDRCVIAYADVGNGDDGYAVVVTMTSGLPTIGTAVEFKDGVTIDSTYVAADGNVGYVAYRNAPTDLEYNSFSVSGHTITFGTFSEYPNDGSYPVAFLQGSVFALIYKDATNSYLTNIDLVTGSATAKALGISIAKGGDEFEYVVYITLWDGVQLAYAMFYMDTLDLIGFFSLGACDESELDAKTYIAYPLAPFGDPLFCWFYGRMNDPSGLGLSHIIFSDDSGVTLYQYENGFGTAHCGSIVDDYGSVYAIRNATTQAKLYRSVYPDPLEVVSTLGFPSPVNPYGLAYSFIEDALYAAASVGNSVMVMRSLYPFTTWTDITYNHATGTGIKAIIPL